MDRLQPLHEGMPDESVAALVREAHIFAAAHGVVRAADPAHPTAFSTMPCTLLPSPVPAAAFEHARRLAVPFNELVHAVAADTAFLADTLSAAAASDSFTAELLRILDATREWQHVQRGVLGIHRSDYMLDRPGAAASYERVLQVELNTISSAFAMISHAIGALHNHILFRCCPKCVPLSRSNEAVPSALAAAWKLFGDDKAVIMMVVQPGEDNVMDQRLMEFALLIKHGIRVIRRSLAEVSDAARVDASNGSLTIDGLVVAVAYFRAGYTPRDYPSDKHWAGRLKIEQSSAIKCPNVAYQLVGAKKVQQELAQPGVLERFVPDAEQAKLLRTCFAGLYSLDERSGEKQQVIERALANPASFVMKPQREGGGNNVYGEKMVRALQTLSARELSAYILMDRIDPVHFEAVLLRNGTVSRAGCISELGIFSTFLAGANGDVLVNEEAGFVLRTKRADAEDGGVSAGVAVMDSPLLT